MTDQLRILQALGEELERATLADEQATRRQWRWRPHGLPLLAGIAVLSITGGAAAATHLFGLAAPVSAPRAGDAPVEARPVASTARLAGVRAADPDGLPAWDVRVSESRTGEVCTAVGQVVDGRFGIVGLDQKFRELPVGAADACGATPEGGDVQVGARAAAGRGTMSARTLVVGIAGPDVRDVAIERDGRLVPLRLGRSRAFVAALTGLPDTVRPRLQVTSLTGKVRTIKLADSGNDEAPDADAAAPPWAISTGKAVRIYTNRMPPNATAAPPRGLVCVSARQQERPGGAVYDMESWRQPGRTPIACRTPDSDAPVVASLRRLVPQLQHEPNAWYYGLSPSRTIAMGLVSDAVVRLELRTPTGPRSVPITSKRSFLVVLDGRVDPTQLELRARLRDGSVARARGETATMLTFKGKPLNVPPAEPWRDLKDLESQTSGADEREKTPGSDQIGPTVDDPAGGPAWAAHTWTATTSRGRGGKTQRVLCSAFGPLVDGEVRAPRGAGVGAGFPRAQLWSGCVTTSEARQARRTAKDFPRIFYLDPEVYVDDPASSTPRIARVVLSGVYPGVQRAEVLGYGRKPWKATVGPNSSVLALLPPTAAEPGEMLRFRLHFPGGQTRTTDYTVFSPPRRPLVARAVDPKGGARWGVRGWNLREALQPGIPGQMVDGRLGRIDDRSGRVAFNSGTMYRIGQKPLSRRNPVVFQHHVAPDDRTGGTDEFAPADIARRTLPGRTLIYGVVAAGIKRVTIHTPRDVRTLRPSKRGRMFIAVYDGQFTQGRIRVVADGPGIHGDVSEPVSP